LTGRDQAHAYSIARNAKAWEKRETTAQEHKKKLSKQDSTRPWSGKNVWVEAGKKVIKEQAVIQRKRTIQMPYLVPNHQQENYVG